MPFDARSSSRFDDRPKEKEPPTARRRGVSATRVLNLVAGVLLIVGGLNWALVAIAEFDLVAAIFGLGFGETNVASRIVYGLVGLAAVFKIADQARSAAGREAPIKA